uniref:MSP domain-containing protein n=1 Tax=Craspedostauros australis TaxID=1486917 RepID=A0A7R9WSF8_9STRA
MTSLNSLEITPDTYLDFNLAPNELTSRTTLTLRHPGHTDDHIAYKIKTTQPRRYLVRPNQGMIAPGGSDTVSILLIEKDKQILLQSYEKLGQTGLDHSKDKFLVQSCVVSSAFSSKLTKDSTELYEALTSMWNSVSNKDSQASVSHRKMHVRHQVVDNSPTSPANGSKTVAKSFKREASSQANVDTMSTDQLKSELTNLRRKYDDLVSFSMNLTAERDILSNTLEQTKRDYNREQATRSALESKQGAGAKAAGGSSSMLPMILLMIIVAIACFFLGMKLASDGGAAALESVPVLNQLINTDETAQPVAAGTDEL